ncbi:hypothetical protein HF282_06430, partial [Acidithiobacillus ferrooxidans]|nr:hypothetical protein [Acidithiobacillus ferrooxidans]
MKKRVLAMATLVALGGIPMAWADSQTIGLQQGDLQTGVAQALNAGAQNVDLQSGE